MSELDSISITIGTQLLNVESETAKLDLVTEILSPDRTATQSQGVRTQIPDDSGVISQSLPPVLERQRPWGFLSCVRTNNDIRLVKDQFLVGRTKHPSLDYSFEEDSLGRHYHNTSRKHFRIHRTPLKSGQWVVSIEDLSTCGTFVNGVSVGKNMKRPLPDKCVISVNRPELEVFTFYDQQYKNTVPGIPAEITANYLVTDNIGKGGFGSVYLVIKQITQKKYAMKAINLEKQAEESSYSRLLNEPSIMYKIRHANIVQIFDVYISKGSYLFIFMEYVEGGTLHNYLHSRRANMTEEQAKFVFYQLLMAISVLHRQNIVHRDVKPLNILCSSNNTDFPHIKLTDFGLSKILNYPVEAVQTLCGTRAYSAPELNLLFNSSRQKKRSYSCYDSRCDVWSVGVVFHYCLSGRLPFVDYQNAASVQLQMRKNHLKFQPTETWSSINFQAKYLISRMLRYEYLERPTSEELIRSSYFAQDVNLCRRYAGLMNTIRSEEFADENEVPRKIPRVDNNNA